MNAALVLAKGITRWSRVRWRGDGVITFDAPSPESTSRGLGVGESDGVAILKFNGRFRYAAAAGKGRARDFMEAVALFANPKLRKRAFGKEKQ
jgi:hypothetical protein